LSGLKPISYFSGGCFVNSVTFSEVTSDKILGRLIHSK